jgi:hypothetical protein
MTGLAYEDLVAAATVGLSHRPLQITGLSGAADEHAGLLDPGDEAAAVLDAAALLVTARRAGVRPVPGLARLPAAADDPLPELPARAAQLLERARADGPALLAVLLGLAADRGFRAPAPLLPALLDEAVRHRELRRAVAGVLGSRGRWLAGHRADWRLVAGAAAAGATPPDASTPVDPGAWETGGRAERRTHLTELRERDPVRARELLAAGWSRETGDDRADLLAVLARGLSPADEEFLEAALDDRKASVRAEAARLLAQLPGSAFTRRAAERAASLLRVERHGARRRLVAGRPERADPAAIRDGISAGPSLLTMIIAAAPLAGWVSRFGLDAAELVSLPVAAGMAAQVRAGWRRAALRECDVPWAGALLAAGWPGPARERPPATWPKDTELAAVLPPDARAARAVALLGAGPTEIDAITQIAICPMPWPGPLADAATAALRRAITTVARSAAAPARPDPIRTGSPAPRPAAAAALPTSRGWPAALAALAGLGLPATGPADHAAVLARLAATDNCPAHWASALRRAADAVALRRAFLKEIR